MALQKLRVRYTPPSKDYKLADCEGLYVLVRPNGSKLWQLKYRFAGKEKLLLIGAYPGISLADARLRRAETKVAPRHPRRGHAGEAQPGEEGHRFPVAERRFVAAALQP